MRHLGLFALALSVCLLSAGMGMGSTFTWVANADTNWTTTANWTPTPPGGQPAATDSVVFYGPGWATTNVTLPTGTTTVANLGITFEWAAWNFLNAAATLDITGNFNYATSYNCTFAPVLDLTGQMILPVTGWSGGELLFSNSGNTIGGGINTVNNMIWFSGNGNTVNGGITVLGDSPASWFESTNGFCCGGVVFAGTGNTFGAGVFNLNRYGYIDLPQTTNLANITAINFNGGLLHLGGAGNTFNSGITNLNVAAGTLMGGANSLSNFSGTISLGGANDYGTLSVDGTVTQNVTLAGTGGWFTTADANAGISGTISGNITGSGQLVKIGTATTTLTGTGNTYLGGTVVGNGTLTVGASSSLGTGNVTICPGATLNLNGPGNLGAGATVLVPKSGAGPYGVMFSAVLAMQTPNFMPDVDPASGGIFLLDGLYFVNNFTGSSAVGAALETAPPGDGMMFLGAQGYPTYSAATLAPGLPDTPGGHYVYRFSSGQLNMEAHLILGSSCLTDVTNPDLSVTPSDVLITMGGLEDKTTNTFTGDITVLDTLMGGTGYYAPYVTWGYSNASGGFSGMTFANGSSFGGSTGNVSLTAGALDVISGGAGAVPAVKNNLSISGGNIIQLSSGSSPGTLAEMDFATLTRVDHGTLVVWPYTTNGLGAAGPEKLKLGNVVNDANGMVPAYIVAATPYNNGNFLTNSPTDGLTVIPYVAFTGSETGGTAVAQATVPTTVTSSSVEALRADAPLTGGTVTLTSGGLILTGTGLTHSTNFVAGNGTAEMFLFCNNNANNPGTTDMLTGTITAGGLTYFGGGLTTIANTVDNSSTLVGDIYVNSGMLGIQGAAGDSISLSVTAADKELGAASNMVVLNGGELWADDFYSGGYINAYNHHQVLVGPAGGMIGGYNSGVVQLGAIGDLDPSNPGILYWGNMAAYSVNTFSGTSIFISTVRFYNNSNVGIGGPIIIDNGGSVYVFYHTGFLDCSTNAMTIVGTGQLNLATNGAMLGSLAGSGTVVWGNPWDPNYDMTVTIGYNNLSTDWYGQMYECENHTGNVTKVGTGTLTIWSDVNWHGPTIIIAFRKSNGSKTPIYDT